jgi:Cu(I)/Ag(I) efflux system membrane protein CusA/SilA
VEDLEESVMDGAVKRLRPKLMAVMAILMGLLSIMRGTGTGEEMVRRIAAEL